MRSRVAISVLIGLVGVLVGFGWTGVVSAKNSGDLLHVTDVVIMEVSESRTVVRYEALVTVENMGDVDFVGTQRIDYQVDGGERKLVYVVSELAKGEQRQFKFRFELEPGERTVGLLVGEVAHETSVTVLAADLSVRVNAEHVVRGGFYEFDVGVDNSGGRVAKEVELRGRWERMDDGEVGEVDFGVVAESVDVDGSAVKLARFELEPGEYRFELVASTSSTEVELGDNSVRVESEVEYVEFDVVVGSTEVVKWHTEGRGLVSVEIEVSNVGVNDSLQFVVGVECVDEACSSSDFARPLGVGESASVTLEVWVPVGSVMVTVYAGANDDGFRWGDENVVGAVFDVGEVPALDWSLSAVSDGEELQYWSDGSANAVFETTLANVGSVPVSGEVQLMVSCLQAGKLVEDCGGEFAVEVDGEDEMDVTRHVVRVPAGETELVFSVGDDDVVTADVLVPRRILGVVREIWECFSDTSNLRRRSDRDDGVGCGGWRNDFVSKWRVGKPIRVWTTGEAEYEAIFDEVLEYLAPLLNVEFEHVETRSRAALHAYLGVDRSERISGLSCNRAAGCTSFDVASDGSISGARLVVWPPLSVFTDAGRDHMIRSIAVHELIHALTGMLHRHEDRTSLMSYDALDYVTLGPTDEELIRIASDPLVEPGMRFSEVRELVVFEDELVDRVEPAEITVEGVLRRVHAKFMDEGAASYTISGGWTGCEFTFEESRYSIGGMRPRASRWVHFKNNSVDLYIIRSRTPLQLLEYWMLVNGRWRPVPSSVAQRVLSFRDSFTSPLTMLSSVNLYRDGAELEVVGEEDGVMTLKVPLGGADVRTGWSENTSIDVQLDVDTSDYTISGYEMSWQFEPEDDGVCDTYRVVATEGEYGGEFEIPDVIRSASVALRLDGDS